MRIVDSIRILLSVFPNHTRVGGENGEGLRQMSLCLEKRFPAGSAAPGPAWTSSMDKRLLYQRYPCIITRVRDDSVRTEIRRLILWPLIVHVLFLFKCNPD